MNKTLIRRLFCFLLFAFPLCFFTPSFAAELPAPYEPPMDWDKPVVSRGFGDDNRYSEEDKLKLAQYKSGQVLYFFGDYAKAIEKWQPLVKQRFTLAQASMGWLYQLGLGVEKDTEKAYQLYFEAANKGNAVAQNNLGVMYEQGIEVTRDFKKARQWYKKSADHGYRFAQFNYANLLLGVRGGAKDVPLAIIWYQKAAEQKVQQAIDKLSFLGK